MLAFRRCLVLTSIDAGALRGDLGDRLMLVDLQRIDEANRRTEAELDRRHAKERPRLLARLLSAVSRTLTALSEVRMDRLPRMADFARILAALDQACPELTAGRSLELYVGQRNRIAGDVVDADPVAAAVTRLIDERQTWEGTSADLLEVLTPQSGDGKPRPPRGWPETARGMSSRLRRVVPALRALRIDVTIPTSRTRDGRMIRIEKRCAEPSQPSHEQETETHTAQPLVTVEGQASQPSAQPSPETLCSSVPGDGGDGSDGSLHRSSDRVRVRI